MAKKDQADVRAAGYYVTGCELVGAEWVVTHETVGEAGEIVASGVIGLDAESMADADTLAVYEREHPEALAAIRAKLG